MPYPHVENTIAALKEGWFLGDSKGRTYSDILSKQFNQAGDKQAIDNGLALGNYLLHTNAQKQKRHALRAVLLANFLMKGFPVEEQKRLRNNYDSCSLEELKQRFVFLFPALLDNGNRPLWDPAYFTPPVNRPDLWRPGDWTAGNIPHYKFIVHSIKNTAGPVFHHPIAELSKYEVLSMSLVSNRLPHSYTTQGVILSVPQNNILIAARTDVAVLNYAQSIHQQDPANPQVACADNIMDVAAQVGGLQSPEYLMQHPRGYPYYNEVVVCGKPDVPLPHGITGRMSLVGVFVTTDMQGNLRAQANTLEIVQRCADNHNVPLLYIPNSMRPPQS